MVINTDPLQGMTAGDMEASIRGIADAPEPGTARPATMREILAQMEGDLAVPNQGELKRGHGYAFIWDTNTYERSVISKNLLPGALTWRREDQTFFYTTSQPKDKDGILLFPWRGDKKCLLNPTHPNVEHYEHLGLPECPKDNIPSEYMVMLHIQHKHSDAWAIIKSQKEDAERTEDRAERKVMMEEMMRRSGASPVVVEEVLAATDPAPIEDTTTNTVTTNNDVQETKEIEFVQSWTETCEVCGLTPEPARSRLGANSRMRSHKNKQHGGA